MRKDNLFDGKFTFLDAVKIALLIVTFAILIGALSGNHAGFHRADGAGYRVVADWLLKLDPLNPQTASRMSTAFETWRRYDATRQACAKAELDRILAAPGLSRDLGEMATRLRGT